MALFEYLHHVGEILVDTVTGVLAAVNEDDNVRIAVGPPLKSAVGPGEEVRVTLLWVTPAPTHRNDGWERSDDGSRVPPPLTLTVTYLISTYGSTNDEDPIVAHNLLGRVLQAFHTEPQIMLPRPPSDRGQGRLDVQLVPTTAELLEKVYSTLQLEHRAWAIFEVGPVQLAALQPARPPAPVVRPGGIRFASVATTPPPELIMLSPRSPGVGGRIRVDLELHGRTLHGLSLGGHYVERANLIELVADRSYVLNVPVDFDVGAHPLRARAGDTELDPPEAWSEPRSLQVLDDTVSTIDAMLTAVNNLGDDLVLAGRVLQTPREVLFWPAGGAPAESGDIESTEPSNFGPSSITVPSTELGGLSPGRWWVSVQLEPHVYTPAIIIEFEAEVSP